MPSVPTFAMKGIEQLKSTFSRRTAKLAGRNPSKVTGVTVGYDAYYAIYVHENLKAFHANGQAKFLVNALMAKRAEGLKRVKQMLAANLTIGQALYAFGKMVEIESRKRVPVKTGALRASAFTRLEKKT